MSQKVCRRCETEKPLEEFGNDSRTPDGRSHLCSECRVTNKGRRKGKGKTLAEVVEKHTRKAKPKTPAAMSHATTRTVSAENDGSGNISVSVDDGAGDATLLYLTYAEAQALRDWLAGQKDLA